MVSQTRWWVAGLAAAGMMALQAGPTAQSTTGSTSAQSYGQSSTENKSPKHHLDKAEDVLEDLERSARGSSSTSMGAGTTTGGSGSTTGSGTTGSGTTGSGTTGSGTTGSTTGSTSAYGAGGDLSSTVSELRRHFDQLEQAYERSSRDTSTTGSTSGTTGSGTTGSGTTGSGTTGSGTTGTTSGTEAQSSTSDSWMTHYSRISQVLDRHNVPKTSTETGTSGSTMSGTTGSSSGTTGSGTTGSGTTGSGTTGSSTSGSMSQSGSSSIDASAMSKLREFRMHIDNFHAAAMAEGSRR